MNKKKIKQDFKLIIMLIIAIGLIISSCANVEAHSIELDPDSVIDFPSIIYRGEGTITIDDSITDYTLYYQVVEISDEDYEQIEEIINTGKVELTLLETEIYALNDECNDLKTIYDEAYQAYTEALENDVDDTELEELQAEYETAQANYQNKLSEYTAKIEEYSEKASEINGQIKELTPSYIEGNWIEAEDDTVNIDSSQFTGTKVYTLWIMLVTSDGTTIYDEAIYTISGTKVESVEVEGISLDRTSLTLQKGSSYTLTATITPTDATNKLVIWSSDNEDVATVSSAGEVSGESVGTATITVTTADGGYTATCEVTVIEESDNTVASGKLPNAGVNALVIIGILVMIAIAIIFYKIYTGYKDVK